tara:strand:- start:7991 stop:9088 length:1098 start_codon:yes stop_codon:yes gene_type:complete
MKPAARLMKPASRRRQQGMALVIVLMLFAILAAVATEVMFRQDRFRTRTENLLDWDKRYQYAMAVEVVAIQGLIDDLEDDNLNNAMVDDCSQEQWAVALPATPYEDAILSASVQDLQGRFNLNWLVAGNGAGFTRNDQAKEMLQRLLEQTLPDPSKASLLANEMADWIDSNNIVDSVEGAEDAEYRSRRTPNMPVAHESELRALRDFTAADLFPDPALWGLFSALPSDTTLNLNTAPKAVLAAVLGTDGAADAVIALRQEEPISDVNAIMQQEPFNSMEAEQKQAISERLGVASEYFQVMVDVEVSGNTSRLVTRVKRASSGGADGTQVFSRQVKPLLAPLEPACNPFYNVENDNNVLEGLPGAS